MKPKNFSRHGSSAKWKISFPSALSSSTLIVRIEFATALRRSLSRFSRSNFSNGIELYLLVKQSDSCYDLRNSSLIEMGRLLDFRLTKALRFSPSPGASIRSGNWLLGFAARDRRQA